MMFLKILTDLTIMTNVDKINKYDTSDNLDY